MAGRFRQILKRGVQFLIANGREADPQVVGDTGEPKGVLRSRTIVGALALTIYPLGIQWGWWDVPQEDWEAMLVPVVGGALAIWGRFAAKKSIG